MVVLKEKNKDWLIVILGVIIGVLLVGNGVLYYLRGRDSSKEEDNTSTKEETKEVMGCISPDKV